MSERSIKLPATFDSILAPSLNYIVVRPLIKFCGQGLKEGKVTFNHKNLVNIYIFYEINLYTYTQGADFTSVNSFFGVSRLTKKRWFDK